MAECNACLIVAGSRRPPGGELLRFDRFVVHGLDGPSAVPAWIVITASRHVRGVYDLTESEWTAVGPLISRVMSAQRKALGAEHVYLFALGDLLHHAHLHLVPRFADTPVHLRGRGVFDAQPADQLDVAVIELAAESVRRALNE